jgi:hypothetical protein
MHTGTRYSNCKIVVVNNVIDAVNDPTITVATTAAIPDDRKCYHK